MQIGAALLAGGKSRRMGSDKRNLTFGGQTFLEQIGGQLLEFPERLLSLHGAADCGLEGFLPVPDAFPGCGPLGGLYTVLRVCRSDALLVVSCDMPRYERSLGLLLAGRLADGYDAVIAVTRDGREHPLCGVYRKTAAGPLEAQLQAGQLRMTKALAKLRVRRVCLEGTGFSDRCLSNINTRAEYQRLLRGM